ncbi:MAG: hypothetical protein DWI28_00605 [Planctomycetota bacterium]|nr:MAG: hypothetical protein DWI28_00605 [Planctomycetota bacterium]
MKTPLTRLLLAFVGCLCAPFSRGSIPFPASSPADFPKITWTEGPEYPMGIQDSAFGIIHGKVISAGGFTRYPKDVVKNHPDAFEGKADGFTKLTFLFDPAQPTDGWKRIADLPGPPRQAALAVVVYDVLYAIGGFSYTEPYSYRSTYRLQEESGQWSWSDTKCDVPWPVCQGSAVAIGKKIYLLCAADFFIPPGASGHNFYTEAGRNNSPVGRALLVLDTTDLKSGWKRLADLPGVPRAYTAVGVAGQKIYALAGLYAPLRKGEEVSSHDLNEWYYNAAGSWAYDSEVDQWMQLPDTPDNANDRAVVFKDRYLVILGGFKYAKTWHQDGTREEVYSDEEKVAAKKQFSKNPEMGAAPLMQRTVMIYDTKTGTFGAGAPMLDQSAWPMATIDGNTIFSLGGEGGVRLWHPATFQIGRIEMK